MAGTLPAGETDTQCLVKGNVTFTILYTSCIQEASDTTYVLISALR